MAGLCGHPILQHTIRQLNAPGCLILDNYFFLGPVLNEEFEVTVKRLIARNI